MNPTNNNLTPPSTEREDEDIDIENEKLEQWTV
jgi:hypothetical protein